MIKFYIPNPFINGKMYIAWKSKFQLFLFFLGLIMISCGILMLVFQYFNVNNTINFMR